MMVQKCAAICISQRPALAVNDAARGMLLGRNVPQFFNANAVNLRLAVFIERKLGFEQFGEMTAHTFCKESIFPM